MGEVIQRPDGKPSAAETGRVRGNGGRRMPA